MKHWPPELKAMMAVARKYRIAFQTLSPPSALAGKMLMWHHPGLAPEDQGRRNRMRELMRCNSTSKCLMENHGLWSVTDFQSAIETRAILAPNTTHTNTASCTCSPCTNEREFCPHPNLCHAKVREMWSFIENTRWDPTQEDPTSPDDTESEDEEQIARAITVPKTILSNESPQDNIRVFGEQWLDENEEKATRETRHQNTHDIFRATCDRPEHEWPKTDVEIGSTSTTDVGNHKTRAGVAHFPSHPAMSKVINLKEEYEIGPDMTHVENDPNLPLILMTIEAIRQTPTDTLLTIHTSKRPFATKLTTTKQARENADFLGENSVNAWRILSGELNSREAPTRVKLVKALSGQAQDKLRKATKAITSTGTIILADKKALNWLTPGIPLAGCTQKALYHLILRSKTTEDKRETTVNLDVARHAAFENNGSYPPDKDIWASARNPNLLRKDQELLWKTLHDGHKIGRYWERMQNPDMNRRAHCGSCEEERESMRHILTECDTTGREEIWTEASKLWKQYGHGSWPKGDLYGTFLAAGVMRFEKDGVRDKGAERGFTIISSTAWRCLWNMRCIRSIPGAQEEEERQLSGEEARARWWKAIGSRLAVDRNTTHKSYGKHARKADLVRQTRQRLLDKPKDVWLEKGTGVLVGSPPPKSGRRKQHGHEEPG